MLFRSLFLLALSPALFAAPLPSREFLETHCFDCHDAETKKGGLDLTALKLDLTDANSFSKWVDVHDRVRAGEMPPPKKKRLPEAETQALLTALDARFSRGQCCSAGAGG